MIQIFSENFSWATLSLTLIVVGLTYLLYYKVIKPYR